MNVVRMNEVTKRYREVAALDGVSVQLAENTIHGLLGRNGAGKTTMMRILTGQEFESAGTVEVFGEHPYENAGVLSRVCFVSDTQRYPDRFRVRHALRAGERLFPNWDNAFAESLMADFALPTNRLITRLSRGQLSAVGVIIGLAPRAPLTLFDEPYLGLDAVARQLFYDRLLADYAEHPRTVVLSTHLIDEVADLIDHGRILIDADTETLRGQAVTVTGPALIVEQFVAGRGELHRERLGGFLRVTVTCAAERPTTEGLEFEPVSLQQLVVRTTQSQLVAANAGQGESR